MSHSQDRQDRQEISVRRPLSPTAADRSPSEVQRARVEQLPPAAVGRERLEAEIARLNTTLAESRERVRHYEDLATAARDAENVAQEQQYANQAQSWQATIAPTTQLLLARVNAQPGPSEDHQALVALQAENRRLTIQLQGELPLDEDDELARFWRALHRGEVNEQRLELESVSVLFLVLPANVFWLGNPNLGSVLVVRESYEGLFDVITDAANALWTNWIVTGNPGIGKTAFSAYFLYRIFRQNRENNVSLPFVYEPAATGRYQERRYLLRADGSASYSHHGVKDTLRNGQVWLIVDANPPRRYGSAKVLLVTNPFRPIYKELEKDGGFVLFMPVWSELEIEAYLQRFATTMATREAGAYLQSARSVFLCWGGIAREVLHPKLGGRQRIQDAIAGCVFQKVINSDVENLASENSILHRVLHIEVLPLDPNRPVDECGRRILPYSRYRLRFASKWVSEQVFRKFRTEERDRLRRFLSAAEDSPRHASLRGQLFEEYASNCLQTGGTFPRRHLETGVGDELQLRPLTCINFRQLTEIDLSIPNRYYSPTTRNLAAVDAILSPNVILQMTASRSHPVQSEGLRLAISRMLQQAGPAVLYFVVPSDIYPTFPRQTYLGVDGRVLETWPAEVDAAQQFALCINIDPL
ncbi:hypothetical protein CAOG_010118 [Capsaspora owczarzaki ATCC 30864]|uniref:Uncharacterized protein n=1 Tax=Capsaspora owczarzaki (strain ATCC 30864) TaxID=595528 RepID=A0A0D2WX82_CAPO3|nr:hypothetical protein CAOG_010118 [Capsaspora owczarzaki ATCC 30864]